MLYGALGQKKCSSCHRNPTCHLGHWDSKFCTHQVWCRFPASRGSRETVIIASWSSSGVGAFTVLRCSPFRVSAHRRAGHLYLSHLGGSSHLSIFYRSSAVCNAKVRFRGRDCRRWAARDFGKSDPLWWNSAPGKCLANKVVLTALSKTFCHLTKSALLQPSQTSEHLQGLQSGLEDSMQKRIGHTSWGESFSDLRLRRTVAVKRINCSDAIYIYIYIYGLYTTLSVKCCDALCSLGEQQRIAFARLLLHKPWLAFLDEATGALDIQTESLLYKILQQQHQSYVSVGKQFT